MPVDYSKYPPDWFTVIRPAILERAGNCCEVCKVPNYEVIFRGIYQGIEIVQDDEGNIYKAENYEFIIQDVYADVAPLSGNENQKCIRIVLTISHLDHNTEHNEYSNLKAMCQKCHLKHDREQHMKTKKEKRIKKTGQTELF